MDRTFDRSEAVPQFLEEAREHLENINSMLVSLEEEFSPPVLEKLLRTTHNLKGEAKMMMFERLGNLFHCFEDAVRTLSETRDPETLAVIFATLYESHDLANRVVEVIDLCSNDEMDGIEEHCRKLKELVSENAGPETSKSPEPASRTITDSESPEPAVEQLVEAAAEPSAPAVAPTMEAPKPSQPAPPPPSKPLPAQPAQAKEEDLFDEIDEEIWTTAIDEINEHCNQLNVNLIQLEKNPSDSDLVKRIFRSMHTIKGTTGILGLSTMNTLSHGMENVLSEIRDGNLKITSDIMDIFFRGMDLLSQFLESAKAREPVTAGIADILAGLEAILSGESPAVDMEHDDAPPPAPAPAKSRISGPPTADHPEPKAPSAMEAQPKPARTEPRQPGAHAPKSPAHTEALRVNIQKLDSLMNSIESLVIDKITLDEQLGALRGLSDQVTVAKGDLIKLFRKLHEILENRAPHESFATQGMEMDELAREEIGEIVQDINQGLTQLDISASTLIELTERLYQSMGRIGRISNELQEGIMLARMVPVSTVFGKFRRTVRDLSKQNGKEIQFIVQGEDTELDKRVIEEISDPLMHILRNSVDHGVETPAQRIQAGKEPFGTVLLSAYYEGNDVVIEVVDDGKGIDPQRIAAKALEQELVDSDQIAAMTQQEIVNLIFTPGFSTAEKVTEISGRGVGMDVVATNITTLNGRVELDSTVGKGTRIKIKIPLTLAIIQALMVSQDDMVFAVPLSTVVETIKILPEQVETVEGREVVSVREKTIPVIRLDDVLELHSAAKPTEISHDSGSDNRIPIVIVAAEDGLYGLMVTDLLGKREIVIKSLGYPLERLRHIMGATLLGDGRVVPILNIPDIVSTAIRSSENRRRKIKKRQAAARDSTHDNRAVNHGGKDSTNILVVDDSQSFAAMLKKMLEDSGFKVDWAKDGIEGMQLVELGAYDLAIIDMEMPRMNGLEMVEKLRSTEKFVMLPVIIATTRAERSDIDRAVNAGANAYLVKPFDKKALFSAISKLISM